MRVTPSTGSEQSVMHSAATTPMGGDQVAHPVTDSDDAKVITDVRM